MDDYLDDQKLEVSYEDPHAVHHVSYRSDRTRGERKVLVEERWLIQDGSLGSGAFGNVRLHSTTDGKQRAVKAVLKSTADKYGVDYKEEIRALTKFSRAKYAQHGLFVDFLGWYENNDFVFLAMEYLPIGDLSNLDGHTKGEADVKAICRQLLEGLEIMHGNGFMHRDLKPQNIFVVQTEPWWIKIGDFGISKRAKPEPGTIRIGTHVGTEGYTAPEVDPDNAAVLGCSIERESYVKKPYVYTNAVDIWSLGCVLYQLVTKQLPFDPTSPRILRRYCKGKISFPREALNDKIHESGIELIQEFLTAKPQLRPSAIQAQMSNWFVETCKPTTREVLPAPQPALDTTKPITRPAIETSKQVNVQVPLVSNPSSSSTHFHSDSVSSLRSPKILGVNAPGPDAKPTTETSKPTAGAESSTLQPRVAAPSVTSITRRRDTKPGIQSIRRQNLRSASSATTSVRSDIATTAHSSTTTKSTRKLAADTIKEDNETEALYQILERSERDLGPDHRITHDILLDLAIVLQTQKKSAEAEPLFRRALAKSEVIFGSDHSNTRDIILDLAEVLYEQKNYTEAEALLRRALAGFEAELGPDSNETRTVILNLGWVLYLQEKYDDAEGLYRRALAGSEAEFGSDHHETQQIVLDLAWALSRNDKFAEAEVFYRRALAGFEAEFGVEHLDTRDIIPDLAWVLYAQDKYDEAELLCRRDLALGDVGPDHPHTLKVVYTLVSVLLYGQEKYIEAEDFSRCALEGSKMDKSQGLHLCFFLCLASVLYFQEKEKEAYLLFQQVLTESRVDPDPEYYSQIKEAVYEVLEIENRVDVKTLLDCAQDGHDAVVAILLEKGLDINTRESGTERTLLLISAQNGHDAVVQLLLEKGADTTAMDTNGWTPLHVAARYRHEAVVALLLQSDKSNPKSKDHKGRTPLSLAVEGGNEAIVRLLLTKGVILESRDQWGQTPLILASTYGHKDIAQVLLENGARIESEDIDTRNSLSWAARKGHEAVIQLLLAKGANIETEDKWALTPLLLASKSGHVAATRVLLEAGAQIEVKDSNGRTPLSWAARNGHEAVVRLLLSKGANAETKDILGSTPLMLASKSKNPAAYQVLLDAHVETTDPTNRMPLPWANKKMMLEMNKLTLAASGT